MHSLVSNEITTNNIPETLPFSLPLELTVNDPEIIAELWAKQEGHERDDYALGALRLGVLAMRQARGQIDANTLKHEGEQLLGNVQLALSEHRSSLDRTLVGTLKDYFDPESGRFSERVQQLVKKDGELENLLTRKVTAADSEMSRTLATLVGKDSPLVRLLSPDESNEFLKALHAAVSEELEGQRTQVLREFSLDNKEGALSRLVGELTDKNGQLRKDLQDKIDALVKQFSFDDEQSALSRMSRTVATTNEAISKHLTLDDKDSALSRLRRELMEVLGEHGKTYQKFQEEVRVTLEKMQARREEAAASTRHGGDFEAVVFEVVQSESQRLKDIATAVGNSTGLIKNCKKGDAVVELGPESTPLREGSGRGEGGCFLQPEDRPCGDRDRETEPRSGKRSVCLLQDDGTGGTGTARPLRHRRGCRVGCRRSSDGYTLAARVERGEGTLHAEGAGAEQPRCGLYCHRRRRCWKSPSRSRNWMKSAPGRTLSAATGRRSSTGCGYRLRSWKSKVRC